MWSSAWQEARADTAAQKLKAMIHVTATVVRDGAATEIPLRDLVPGDIIKLAAGDMIPGDVRLISSNHLFVSQESRGDSAWRNYSRKTSEQVRDDRFAVRRKS